MQPLAESEVPQLAEKAPVAIFKRTTKADAKMGGGPGKPQLAKGQMEKGALKSKLFAVLSAPRGPEDPPIVLKEVQLVLFIKQRARVFFRSLLLSLSLSLSRSLSRERDSRSIERERERETTRARESEVFGARVFPSLSFSKQTRVQALGDTPQQDSHLKAVLLEICDTTREKGKVVYALKAAYRDNTRPPEALPATAET